jgi:predicted RNA-binding Zn ribbon-like protein
MTGQSTFQVTTPTLPIVSLPPWVPHIETKPAPMPLLLVQAFVNTYEADADTDLLREPEPASGWLTSAGLLAPEATLGHDALALARAVRENIRALLVANTHGTRVEPADLEPLATLARRCQPRLRLTTTGDVQLEAAPDPGLDEAWLRLLLIIRDAQLDRTWRRLKACGNDACGWAFYDRSHSRRGRWCDMSTCGNRMKNRDLRARQRDTRTSQRS